MTAKSSFFSTKVTRRGLLRGASRVGMGALATGGSSLGWGRYVEPDWVEVEPVEVKLPRLGRAFDGLRIAQISDIHIEGGDMRVHLPAICRKVNAQGADAIVITGDFVTDVGRWQEDALVPGLSLLGAPLGVYGVLGNHDQWVIDGIQGSGSAMVRRALRRSGIRELCNEHISWQRDGQTLHLCGLDDWNGGNMDFEALLRGLPGEGAAILLQHQPDFADIAVPASKNRFDLMLTGHSHGGQIALPFLGPVHLPHGARKYPRGEYQIEDMVLYTNRGLGTIDLPVRFCARPEITVFTLRAV